MVQARNSQIPHNRKYEYRNHDVNSLGADEVIIATGAVPNRIPVKGAEKGIEACDFLLGKKQVGEKVVIIGGGLTGCEIAYELYLQGKKPTIVEMQNDLIVSDKNVLQIQAFCVISLPQTKCLHILKQGWFLLKTTVFG